MGIRTSKNKQNPPKMTAHQFEYIAYILRQIDHEYSDPEQAERIKIDMASLFADNLRATNGRFDRNLFMEAVLEDE